MARKLVKVTDEKLDHIVVDVGGVHRHVVTLVKNRVIGPSVDLGLHLSHQVVHRKVKVTPRSEGVASRGERERE